MRTTKEDYERFKAEFSRLQKLLGLTGWSVTFYRRPLEDCYAQLYIDTGNAVIGATYSSNTPETARQEPELVARHEIGHLLVAKLASLARERFGVTEDQIYEQTERIANSLENVLTEKAW